MRTDRGRGTSALDHRRHRSEPVRGRRHEPVEDRQRVERPRRAFRVVLDGLDRQFAVAQALDRAVVEVDLADVEAAARRAGSRRRP